MNTNTINDNKLVYYRLIALWVVCETLVGGIIHSFSIPFSSIVLSGFSVVCISLISKVTHEKGSILKATIIVIIFKFLLSPQSPPPAYLAVFLQGAFGEFLFANFKTFRLNCILLGVFALAESALQRIIVLLILFGNDFPKAINKFVQSAFSKNVNTNYSLYLAGAYILIHIIFGAMIGWFAFSLSNKSLKDESFFIQLSNKETDLNIHTKKKTKKLWLIFIWIIMIVLLIYSWKFPANKILSSKSVLLMLVRSAIILLSWYLFLSPIVLFYFKRWARTKSKRSIKIFNR